jgi:hypothetical protein
VRDPTAEGNEKKDIQRGSCTRKLGVENPAAPSPSAQGQERKMDMRSIAFRLKVARHPAGYEKANLMPRARFAREAPAALDSGVYFGE